MISFQQLGRLGRFGNQLFQIAGTIGIARKHGYDFGFPEWINYDHKDRFGSSEDCDIQKYFVNRLPQSPPIDFENVEIPWGYHNTYVRDNVSLHGHLQSERYFKHCIEEVRYYFKMPNEPNMKGFLAIHLRRGDYDDRYHPRLNFEYYLRALTKTYKPDGIIIFSDDKEQARALGNLIHQKTDAFVQYGTDSYITDFAIMKTCSQFICANSSFSLMAAILSEDPDKRMICPSNWFGPAWGSCFMEMAKDIYPENCIIV